MISGFVYLVNTIILGLFCYKTYLVGYGKNNIFAKYLFWSSLFITVSFLKSVILIFLAISLSSADLLFWADFFGRILFYTAGAFAVQIPLYKFFPNNKKNTYVSYFWILIGIVFVVFQLLHRNEPFIEGTGIINWGASVGLTAGMALLVLAPWAVTSFIFIREFVKSKFTKIKSFLLGSGWFFVCIGATFQDSAKSVFFYILFGIILMLGFMSVLAGLFYEESQN